MKNKIIPICFAVAFIITVNFQGLFNQVNIEADSVTEISNDADSGTFGFLKSGL